MEALLEFVVIDDWPVFEMLAHKVLLLSSYKQSSLKIEIGGRMWTN